MERQELLVGAPIRGCWYDRETRRLLLSREASQVTVVTEEGRPLMHKACGVHRVVLVDSNAFLLHGSMISMVPLGTPDPVLVSNFERGLASLVAFAGDGSYMVSSNTHPRILFSPQDDGQPEFWILAHNDVVTALVCSSSGDPSPCIFSGARDGTIRKWAVGASGAYKARLASEFIGCSSFVTTLLLCSKDQVLVSASKDGTIRLWVADGAGTGKEIACVRFNKEILMLKEHEGALFSTHDTGVIMCWLLLQTLIRGGENQQQQPPQQQQQQIAFQGHYGIVTDLAFHKTHMLSASLDCTLRIWSIETGESLRVIRGHTAPVTGCFFNSRGLVCSASVDGGLCLWKETKKREPLAKEIRVAPLQSLCSGASLLSRVISWLDPFLEATAERDKVGADAAASPVAAADPISVGATEVEQATRNALRTGLRALVPNANLWKVYNLRVQLGALFQAIATCISQVEACSLAVEDLFVESFCGSVNHMLGSVEKDYVPNVASIWWLAELVHSAKLAIFWERRLGTVVPHSSFRQLVTLIPESLFAFLKPTARLLMASTAPELGLILAQALSKICSSWGLMRRTVRRDVSAASVGQVWREASPPNELRAVPSSTKACLKLVTRLLQLGRPFAEYLEEGTPCPDFLFHLDDAGAASGQVNLEAASCATLWQCLLHWLAYRSEPLFPELHECWSPAEMNKRLAILAPESLKVIGLLCHTVNLACDKSQTSCLAAGSILGPLLAQCPSLIEGTLAGSCCITMIQDAGNLVASISKESAECQKFFQDIGVNGKPLAATAKTSSTTKGSKKSSVGSANGSSSCNGTLRVPKGHESEVAFGVLGYSMELDPATSEQVKLTPSPRSGGGGGETPSSRGGTIRRREKGLIVATQVSAISEPLPTRPQEPGILSPKKNWNDTIWDDLLGLIDETEAPSKFAALLPNGTDSVLGTTTSGSGPAATLTMKPLAGGIGGGVGGVEEDVQDMDRSMRKFLSLEDDQSALRSVVEEDENDMEAPLREDPDGEFVTAPLATSWAESSVPCPSCGVETFEDVCQLCFVPIPGRAVAQQHQQQQQTAAAKPNALAKLKSATLEKVVTAVRERSSSISRERRDPSQVEIGGPSNFQHIGGSTLEGSFGLVNNSSPPVEEAEPATPLSPKGRSEKRLPPLPTPPKLTCHSCGAIASPKEVQCPSCGTVQKSAMVAAAARGSLSASSPNISSVASRRKPSVPSLSGTGLSREGYVGDSPGEAKTGIHRRKGSLVIGGTGRTSVGRDATRSGDSLSVDEGSSPEQMPSPSSRSSSRRNSSSRQKHSPEPDLEKARLRTSTSSPPLEGTTGSPSLQRNWKASTAEQPTAVGASKLPGRPAPPPPRPLSRRTEEVSVLESSGSGSTEGLASPAPKRSLPATPTSPAPQPPGAPGRPNKQPLGRASGTSNK